MINNCIIFSIKVVEEPCDDEVKHKDSTFVSAVQCARQRVKAVCTKKTLYKRLPILRWLPKYNGEDALGDFVAGITVGLTVIPQSLAYSSVAGLPPQVMSSSNILVLKKFSKNCTQLLSRKALMTFMHRASIERETKWRRIDY